MFESSFGYFPPTTEEEIQISSRPHPAVDLGLSDESAYVKTPSEPGTIKKYENESLEHARSRLDTTNFEFPDSNNGKPLALKYKKISNKNSNDLNQDEIQENEDEYHVSEGDQDDQEDEELDEEVEEDQEFDEEIEHDIDL